MVERYPGASGRSEYGGGDGDGDGDPQRTPDGKSIDLPGLPDKASERARLMRIAGLNDFDANRSDAVGMVGTPLNTNQLSPAQQEAYEKDLELSKDRADERARLAAKTNGYINEPEQYTGESGEGNGVASLDS